MRDARPGTRTNIRAALAILGLLAILLPARGNGRQKNQSDDNRASRQDAQQDARHDFDFDIGTWKTHLKRLVHPLTGSTTWIDLDGTTLVRKIWDGRANLAELAVDTPSGRIDVLSLRLYNPQSHQWSLNTANSRVGTLSVPTVGEFKNGRGEFFDQEEFNGRMIQVRNVWTDITPNSCRFEQSFSDDGGKTWELNWIAVDTRVD
jgi:hypothetical protein